MKLRKIGFIDQLMRRYTRKLPKNDAEEWTPLESKAMLMLFAVLILSMASSIVIFITELTINLVQAGNKMIAFKQTSNFHVRPNQTIRLLKVRFGRIVRSFEH